jgi:hypothetical protein
LVPAVVILLVAALELRRWLERRRRDREMAQALREFLGRATPSGDGLPDRHELSPGGLPETPKEAQQRERRP